MPVTFSQEEDDVREVARRPVVGGTRPTLVPVTPEMVVGYYATHMAFLIKVFIFLDGCTHNGITHLVNVYLVVLEGWTSFEASWIWFTRDVAKFCLQAYAGGLVDKTERKKALLVLISLMKVASGVIMVTTTAAVPQIIKGALDGAIVSFVLPVTTALTLGIVGKTKFHRKHAQLNIMMINAGQSLSVIILGGVAWAIYPDITNVFYQFIVVGVLCLICVLLMPGKETADHNVARGQEIRGGKDHWITRSMGRGSQGGDLLSRMNFGVADSDSESEDEEENKLVKSSSKDANGDGEEEKSEEEKTEEGGKSQSNTDKKSTRKADRAKSSEVFTEYTNVLTLRDMCAEPTRRTSLIFLALTFFSFHLVNATVLPLLGQYIGAQEALHEDARSALPSMAGLVVLKEVGSFLTNWFFKSRLTKQLYSRILIIGCGILLLRMVLISVLINYTDNLWALGSTNILEGAGNGCLDLALALYSHLLSRQTGHYNLNMGIVATFKTLGSAFSILLGGALATYEDYNIAFPVLTAMMVFPIFFSTRVHTPYLYGSALD